MEVFMDARGPLSPCAINTLAVRTPLSPRPVNSLTLGASPSAKRLLQKKSTPLKAAVSAPWGVQAEPPQLKDEPFPELPDREWLGGRGLTEGPLGMCGPPAWGATEYAPQWDDTASDEDECDPEEWMLDVLSRVVGVSRVAPPPPPVEASLAVLGGSAVRLAIRFNADALLEPTPSPRSLRSGHSSWQRSAASHRLWDPIDCAWIGSAHPLSEAETRFEEAHGSFDDGVEELRWAMTAHEDSVCELRTSRANLDACERELDDAEDALDACTPQSPPCHLAAAAAEMEVMSDEVHAAAVEVRELQVRVAHAARAVVECAQRAGLSVPQGVEGEADGDEDAWTSDDEDDDDEYVLSEDLREEEAVVAQYWY